MSLGHFIVIDGVNGSGKSTIAKLLWEKVYETGHLVELHSDPGSTEVGEAIRKLVKNPRVPMRPMTQFLMYSAARAELAAEIDGKLHDGITVIMDRWWPSTFAYQGANGIEWDLIKSVTRALSPPAVATQRDKTFILDCPLHLALSRSKKAAPPEPRRKKVDYERGNDRFEAKGWSFLEKVVNQYSAFVALGEATMVDVSGSAEEVADFIWARHLKELFPTRRRSCRRKQPKKSPAKSLRQSSRSRRKTSGSTPLKR